jgi:hypothetical protein
MMLFSLNTCRFLICFLSLPLSATSETVRGARKLLESKVELLTAGNYVILAKTGISSVPASAITGDIAVSPIAGEAMTGFSLTMDSGNTFGTSTQLSGQAFAANYAAPIPSQLTTAVSAMEAAYTDAAGRPNPDAARINLLGGSLSGVTLTPGVYTFGSDVFLTGDITFSGAVASPVAPPSVIEGPSASPSASPSTSPSASPSSSPSASPSASPAQSPQTASPTGSPSTGDEGDVFIIQITGNLVQAANMMVHLTNGALAKNIFWQIAGNVAVGAGSHMEGILLVKTDVTFVTGSSLNGRVLSQTACNLQSATITQP